MGLIISRLNLDGLRPRRRRSQQEDTLYSYSLNKNYFSNYFLMGGERFEVNDPDYLFGDICDLNFLTCTKPYSLPYKNAQQSLLVHLNNKQKAMNKVSSRVNSLSSPLNILTGRNRQVSHSRKQDAQTQTLNKALSNGPEPSQPLIMLINIRKETLRLVRGSNVHNIDSDQNSLITNTASISNASPVKKTDRNLPTATKKLSDEYHPVTDIDECLTSNPRLRQDDMKVEDVDIKLSGIAYYTRGNNNSDSSSITSNTLSSTQSTVTSRSGYTSVKEVPPSDCASDENDECYQDALNEPTNLSIRGDNDDNDSVEYQARDSTKENHDIKITIDQTDRVLGASRFPSNCDMSRDACQQQVESSGSKATSTQSKARDVKSAINEQQASCAQSSNRVYNIEFTFDAEVDCSIRIFYFCTREVTSNNVSYKPQHATYKSKTYTYKRGLNQKFEQQEHTFQPYLFDEDLLIYKPLDLDGNYNSGAVFPIVIHMVALGGASPRQSQSLVATVEKSQLDESYSIKALKQLIFVDGVQYILQDIYGIENRPLTSSKNATRLRTAVTRMSGNFRSSCASLESTSNFGSNMNLSDTASVTSVLGGYPNNDTQDGGASLGTNQFKSLGSENTFECVICMSDERDTMLLPCRHLCLCSSCAQSLRYHASSCPICRCPFKAALNLRVIQRGRQQRVQSFRSVSNEALETNNILARERQAKLDISEQHASTTTIVRRESITSPATPLLSQSRSTAAVSASDRLDSPDGGATLFRSVSTDRDASPPAAAASPASISAVDARVAREPEI